MFKAENFGVNWLDLHFPFPCEIHHCYARRQPDPRCFRVLSHYTEPRPLKWPLDKVRKYANLFDLILTNEEALLDLPNVQFALFGGCWINGHPQAKRFETSFLYSSGMGAEQHFAGYRMRRAVWCEQGRLSLPKAFYTSAKRPPKRVNNLYRYPYDSKTPLFESMFSVIIENDRQLHFFTEKIVDALRTYTVPLYFGAPNIGKYFDIEGILVFRTVEELVGVANSLTPDDYWSRVPAMARNFELSGNYVDILRNMQRYVNHGFERSGARRLAGYGNSGPRLSPEADFA